MSTSKQYKELTQTLLNIVDSLPEKVRAEFVSRVIDDHAPSSSAGQSASENPVESDISEDESELSDECSINEMTAQLARNNFCFFMDTASIVATKPKGVLRLDKTSSGGFKVIHTAKLSKRKYEFVINSIDVEMAIKHLSKLGWSNFTSSVVWCTCAKRDATESSKARSAKLCLLRKILASSGTDKTLAHINSLKNLVDSSH